MARWSLASLSTCVMLALAGAASAQVVAPRVENVVIPSNVDPFNLSFEEFKKYSSAKNFELIGHTYFKIPERTPWAKGQGRPGGELGSGFNGARVYDGIAYLGGFNSPPTLFGILMILLPLAGLLSLIWLLGAYSVFFGALLLAVALRLRARWRATEAAAAPPA